MNALPTANSLYTKIKSGNIVALSKTITYLESKIIEQQKLAHQILSKGLPNPRPTMRIGITGVPGVGKSTFLECIGQKLIEKGHKIAILAIDPTSTKTGGSVLGDKTRMEQLSKSKNVFIRPSPAGNTLGGVATNTRETIFLCEMACFDIVFVETLGVGQAELAAYNMVDIFVLLTLPNAGDELQGIKRGITELADLVIVNKCDSENVAAAKLAAKHIKNALHFFPKGEHGTEKKVMLCSATEMQGFKAIIAHLFDFKKENEKNNLWEKRRHQQAAHWFKSTVQSSLQQRFFANKKVSKTYNSLQKQVENGKKSSLVAAEELLHLYF